MANCTYTFTGGTSVKGIPALKAFLLEGGLDTYLPERAMEMQGPSASARQTDTPAFKKWFGDSEVVDDAGKPMVVYHSTPKNFSVFDTARSELGSHFGPVEQANAFGGSNGRRIMPVYLSIKKPIRLVDYGQWDAANTWGQLVDLGVVEDKGDKISDSLVGMATGGSGDKVVQDALIKAGYDGIVYLNRREGFDPFGPDGVDGNELGEMTDEEVMAYFPEAQDSYIVFKPTQTKSAIGNTGAFDPENPDIRYSAKQEDSKIINPVDPNATAQEKVKTLVRLTRENRPIVKKLMAEIDAAIGTKSSDNVKAPEKILQKASRPSILLEKPWHDVEHIRDSYRFKTIIDSVTQLPEVTQMLDKAGIEIIKRDTDKVLSPGKWGWRIAAFDLRMPNGQLVEYYLPVKELETAKKEKGHYLFEQGRNVKPGEDVEKVQGLMQESRDLYQGVWDAYLARTGDSLTDIRAALTKAAALSEEAISYPSADRSRTLSPAGAGAFQSPSGERAAEKSPSKTKTPPAEPTQATDIRTSDLSTNAPIIPDSRAFAKNAAASRVEGTSEDRFKRTPALQQAVVDLQEGKITQGEYNRMVDELRPVYPYKEVPAVTTPKDARYALENGRGQSPDKAAQYGVPAMTLKTGDWAQLRLDIPSYQLHDTWVVTVHTPKSTNREVQAAYDAGPRVGYESVAAMTDVTFGMNQKAAAKIAAGSSKGTIATMLGKWSPISKADAKARAEAAMKDKSWTQVGMDPFRHSYFYDRDSMRPVLSADEVIQIGPLVLAKNVQFGEDTDITGAQIAFSARQFQSAQGQRFTLQDETYTKTAQRNLQDYFVRVADVQDALSAQGGVVGEAQNVYLAEELSYGRLQEQMVDFKEDMLKPLIKATKAAGLELSDLALYAYAKHAPERNQAISARNKTFGKGEGSGMTTSEANNIMRAFKADGKDKDLAALHAQLMQITQATRLVLLSEGLITQDQFDALQRQYADYVPLRGFVEDEDLESGRPVSGPRVGGKGFNIRGKETMRALGRESRAGHVIENIVIDYERAIARSERNTVAKVFLDLVTSNPDPGLWEIDTVRTKAAFDRATGMVKYNTLIDKGEDTISVKIDGKEIYIKIKDPLLLRAMRAAGKDETGAIDRVLAMSVGRYTALMRNTLTRYNPAFGFTNAVKDIGFGAVSALSDLGPKGTALFFKNYANPVQSGQMFEEFRAAGATTGGWHIRDQQEMQRELQRLVEWEGGSSVKSTAYSMGKATLDALEFIGQYSETQARFAAYKAARQLNKSPAEAASIAKNLTTNFNRKGEWGSAINTLYLFYNAGVQGSVKTLKNLRSPYVMAAMAGLSGLAAGLAFMGAGVGGDDDDGEAYWDKIPQFEKERNLILMLPPGEGMMIKGESKVGKNGRYFKLPIQYGINVFSTLGYQIADLARYTQNHSRGVSPAKAATNMVSVTFGSFNPFGGGFNPSKPTEVALAISPSVVDLGVQALMGVNSFGTPVAPRKYDDIKPDSENFGPGMAGTWEQRLARWLSESTGGDRAVGGAIDVSPGSIRNIVRNLTGGTGDFLTSVFVNIPSKMWSPEGEVGPRDVPVLKAFYGEVDEVTDSKLFYERKAEVLEAAKQAADRQKLGIEVDYDDESRGLQSLGKSAKSYTKKMTELRKKELKVAEDSSLTETQKKADRKDIQKERAQIASEFNALYYEMRKDLARK